MTTMTKTSEKINTKIPTVSYQFEDYRDWAAEAMGANQVLHCIENGINTVRVEKHWKKPKNFRIIDFVGNHFTNYNAYHGKYICKTDFGVCFISSDDNNVDVDINGTKEWVQSRVEEFEKIFGNSSEQRYIEWIINSEGNSVTIPLNYKPLIQSAYPFVSNNISEYITEYMESEANILLLIGAPGTGKTSFIREIIQQSGRDAYVSYDEKILSNDQFFGQFVSGDKTFLIIEDSDNMISSRKDGNNLMHRFLNVSDGLISSIKKKLIFTTNLTSIRSVDNALVRPGRCFDTVQFRKLSLSEASKVAKEIGKADPKIDGITLAEIFNQPHHKYEETVVGF